MKQEKRNRKLPGHRDDGVATRWQILEAAGEVFAEKGVAYATGKEIAERAGVNSAAVNYYFRGIDGLYAEVLVEAHHRLMDLEFLKKISEAPGRPEDKLSVFIDGMLRAVLGPMSSNWALRVLGREILHPSTAFPILLERELLPKMQIATAFISEILGVPPDHPAVARSRLAIIAPFALLLLGSSKMLEHAAPHEAIANQPDAAIEHFKRFFMGGLAQIASDLAREKAGNGDDVAKSPQGAPGRSAH